MVLVFHCMCLYILHFAYLFYLLLDTWVVYSCLLWIILLWTWVCQGGNTFLYPFNLLYSLTSHSSDGKESPCNAGDQGFDPWIRKIPWRRKWQSTPVFLPGEFHGQRSLVVYSPWGHKELDMTERLTLMLCTHRAASLCCTADTNRTLESNHQWNKVVSTEKNNNNNSSLLGFLQCPQVAKGLRKLGRIHQLQQWCSW